MSRKQWIFLVLLVGANMIVWAQEHPRRHRQPFVTDTLMVHDPVMAFENGIYYLYATGHHLMMATSTDCKRWTVVPSGLIADMPGWTHDSVPGFTSHAWAPDIIRWHDRWWLTYSCSTFGRNTSAIGLMTNSTLDPTAADYCWQDMGCLVASQSDRDNWNAIDPNIIIDANDRPWLTWGSFWDGVQLLPLDTLMRPLPGFAPRTIARRYAKGCETKESNPTSKFAGRNAIEAPFIFRHAGYYYLFVSWDYCCRGEKSNYRVVCGRSEHVEGPYYDHMGIDMRLGGGKPVFAGDKHDFEAAGHCSVYRFGNDDIFLCHGYSIPLKGASILVQRKIRWSNDGWPELE